MSNKIVPAIYRSVIDDVIQNMRSDFDDYGVSEEVLSLLQDKWETKIIASGVAEFEPPSQPPPPAQAYHNPMPTAQQHHPSAHGYPLPPVHTFVKTEPVERPYVSLAPHPQQMQQYMLPPMKGRPAGQSVLALPRGAPPARPAPSQTTTPNKIGTPGGGSGGRIPQLDGPSYSSESTVEPPATMQTSGPRIPQIDGPASSASSSDPDSPNASGSPAKSQQTTGEEINSDLDDSDSDNDNGDDAAGGGHADQDIVFCTYDKVARVKNKWKCTLKDGMIHVNGKDYLFAKCNGEFEW